MVDNSGHGIFWTYHNSYGISDEPFYIAVLSPRENKKLDFCAFLWHNADKLAIAPGGLYARFNG